MEVKPEQIKEIAEMLDMGMACFIHKTNGMLEFYPDPDKGEDFDEDTWADVIKKVQKNLKEYTQIDAMPGREAFGMMEGFIAGIKHIQTRAKFSDAISGKKPFRQFNNMLSYYPDLRQEWFKFKTDCYMKYVREEIKDL